jgi:hypothetical protein
MPEPLHTGPGSTPVPDPTALTTAALFREIEHLKEIVFARLDGNERITAERFHSIQVQFAERDTRAEQSGRDSKTAVDAALQAAKEAVGAQTAANDRAIAKAEAATAEQIRQLAALSQTANTAQTDKIDDLKDRITRAEGALTGSAAARATLQTSSSALGAIIFGILGTLLGLAGLFSRFVK